MKCCGKDLGRGTPYVMVRYWCAECNTEHLVDAQELTDYVALLNARAEADNAGSARLPNLL